MGHRGSTCTTFCAKKFTLKRLVVLFFVWSVSMLILIGTYSHMQVADNAYKAMFQQAPEVNRFERDFDYEGKDYFNIIHSGKSMKLMATNVDKDVKPIVNQTQTKRKNKDLPFLLVNQNRPEWGRDEHVKEKEEEYSNKLMNDTTNELMKLLQSSELTNMNKSALLHKLSGILGEDLFSEFLSKLKKSRTIEDDSNPFRPEDYPLKVNLQKHYQEYVNKGRARLTPINKDCDVLLNPSHKCNTKEAPKVVFVVKTSPSHYKRRSVIRTTWGNENNFPSIRVVFSLGVPEKAIYEERFQLEWKWYKDILLVDYLDTYYNLTLKTISGLNWAHKYCSNSQYIISVDDDVYVATDILLSKLENLDKETADRLFTGHIYYNTGPLRDYDGYYAKWNVNFTEYPWDNYPMYAYGGFVVMSKKTVSEFVFAAKYTETFKFEDVYLGILASRMGIEASPVFDPYVDNYVTYSSSEAFKTIVASHGYGSRKNLRQAWECHLGLVQNNLEKLVYCQFIDVYLKNIKDNFDEILSWIENAREAI